MKKDCRKIMLKAMYQKKHFLALERGDEKDAQMYLDKLEDLKNMPVFKTKEDREFWDFIHK